MPEHNKISSLVVPQIGHPPSLSSSDLFRRSNTVCIEHQGQQYWLRLTRGNKLILTK
jgi:hemin uptake protein HemP